MIFRPNYDFGTGCASYLVGCTGQGLCAVIDAREEDVEMYVQFASMHRLRVTHVFDTHIHADHRSGGPALAQRFGAAYCLHESADVDLSFEAMHDGQIVAVGNVSLLVRHTPGHTPESMSLVLTDLRRGTDPWLVFTGDTLFVGAVGRPDLPGSSVENAGQLYDSLHQKLMVLPDAVELYPSHFAGSACGAGMSGKPSSTLGFERRWNAFLSMSRPDFMSALQDVAAKPVDMRTILRRNQGRP
jgi:glyoxylase-like metal-dependent hydrolase (beta-lactamase superfamily II)